MPLTRNEVQAKIEEHRKMGRFYRRYANALDVVESFDFTRNSLDRNDGRFCLHPSCFEVISWNNNEDLCMRHTIMQDRRTVREFLDD